eukprot:4942985-Pleurochrysis_carterae.AAC.1
MNNTCFLAHQAFFSIASFTCAALGMSGIVLPMLTERIPALAEISDKQEIPRPTARNRAQRGSWG